MPDYNPDREGHVGHRFIVQKAWPATDKRKAIKTSAGPLAFGKEDRLMVKDPALAREIQQDNPADLAVTRVRYNVGADQGHKYHFGQMPAMPWHKYDANGNRIKEPQQADQPDTQQDDEASDED